MREREIECVRESVCVCVNGGAPLVNLQACECMTIIEILAIVVVVAVVITTTFSSSVTTLTDVFSFRIQPISH